MTGLTLLDALAVASLVLAAIPFGLSVFNLLLYRAPLAAPEAAPASTPANPDPGTDPAAPEVSILIPARDEEATIGRAVRAA
ncbi:MAG: hypothetical protein AAFX50_14125, partial [Acidobacteriota bacterium]